MATFFTTQLTYQAVLAYSLHLVSALVLLPTSPFCSFPLPGDVAQFLSSVAASCQPFMDLCLPGFHSHFRGGRVELGCCLLVGLLWGERSGCMHFCDQFSSIWSMSCSLCLTPHSLCLLFEGGSSPGLSHPGETFLI